MCKNHNILAIIPARGGSKRLPGKNMLPLAGKPLIAWTIEAAKKSKYIKTVCVSTDCEELKEIALKWGAEVPFIRPTELATDTANSVDVALHALEWYEKKKVSYDTVILLQPTSPLRDFGDINKAIEMFIRKNANSVTSVCETDHSPLWANTLPNDLSMDGFIRDEVKNVRSQDLPKYYRLNGGIYIIRTVKLKEDKAFIATTDSFAFIMGKIHSIDIDTKLDFMIAESIKCQNF